MEILSFVTTAFQENCIVIKEGEEAMVIDPGEATEEVVAAIAGCSVKLLVNTHGHVDHVGGNAAIKELTGAELVCHEEAAAMLELAPAQGEMLGLTVPPSPPPDRFIDEGDTLTVGSVSLGVVNCPGHAPGHIALVGEGFIIGGDVLFSGSIGRTDLPGGDYDTLISSIKNKFLTLSDDTVVYCGHGPPTTIGVERQSNPFLGSA